MTKLNKVTFLPTRDKRVDELLYRIEETVFDYAVESKMNYSSVIGVLRIFIHSLEHEAIE